MAYKLKNFISDQGGLDATAKRLKMTSHGVRVWLDGRGAPKSSTLIHLAKLSKNRLNILSVLKETTRNLSK